MKRYEYNYGKNPEGALSTISGYATETTNFGETAFGILNKSTRDEENFTTPEVVSSSTATLFSVGNGTDHDSRKNIIELKADGTVYISGVGQYDGTNPGEATSIADEFQGIHDDITGVNEDIDRIDNTIESIHISEDNANLIYTLLVDGKERGTINIPRDQFLKNVSYNEETNNLEFTFIVRGENNEEVEKQVNVNMTDLEDIYSAGNGLNLENKQFSVKVDADTQPYIEVSSNGVKIIGINEVLDTKVDWQENKTSIYLPVNGSIIALRNDSQGGGVLICQRSYDDEATYVTEVGTTMNNLTLNSVERPKIDFADGSSQNVAYESEITDISSSLNNYLPLTGGTVTGLTEINGVSFFPNNISTGTINIDGNNRVVYVGLGTIQITGITTSLGTPGLVMTGDEIYFSTNGASLEDPREKYISIGYNGITLKDKSNTDLLNAAGSTTSISDILAEVPAPDLSSYATKEEVGSNIYTDSNYLSKETNLTDAVLQLDEEIKATNDNLDLEHANAEATYAKKTDLSGYLPLSGGTLTGQLNGTSIGASAIVVGDTFMTGNQYLRVSNITDNNTYLTLQDSNNNIVSIGYNGVTIPNKTASDLLNAGGSTTPISNIVTQVQAAIVDSAPETLDTLNELAAALGDDPNFATTVTNQIAQKADKTTATTSTDGLMSAADKTRLDNSIYDFEVHIHNYSLGQETRSTEDGLKFALSYIRSSSPSAEVESCAEWELPLASNKTNGVMSIADKAKLDSFEIQDSDIVASGFRKYGGKANEVLTADGDKNTLKTIDGQTLLGSGDVNMSKYFKLDNDNMVTGTAYFSKGIAISSPLENGSALSISGDNGKPFISCRNYNSDIVTLSSDIFEGVVYPTFQMIAAQANAFGSDYEKVMFSIDRDEDGLTKLSLGNFDVSKGGDIIRGTDSYITSNGITLPGKGNRDFLVGNGTTVGLSDLSNDIVMTTGDQVVNGSKRFNQPIETVSIHYDKNAVSSDNTFLYYYNSVNSSDKIDDYTILSANMSDNGSPYRTEIKINSIQMSSPSGTSVRLSSEKGGYLNLGFESNKDNPGLKINSDGLKFRGHNSNELINAGGGFTSADTFVKTSSGSKTIWTGTQSEYEGVTIKDANTLYFITEG